MEREPLALSQRGLAINNPNQKHQLRHYRGGSTVSALEAACVYYAGLQLLLPGQDPGIDLGREYAMARGMVGGEGRGAMSQWRSMRAQSYARSD